jgi:hypothetical protein
MNPRELTSKGAHRPGLGEVILSIALALVRGVALRSRDMVVK